MGTPLLCEFNPELIPWQKQVISYNREFNYSAGINEIMFSGSIGSAKSVEGAHLIARHCLENKGARVLIVRRALKDLKRTMWQLLLKHISDCPHLVKSYNKTELRIIFVNGSEIIGDSYDDYNLEKFRSLELSMAVIEEASESERELYDAIKMRVGRIPNVKRNMIIAITNPDSPSHYLYEYFMEKPAPTRKVFFSVTSQNPFLPKWYIENLERDLDPKMARRMLYGEWLEISRDVVYYNYNEERNFLKNKEYVINKNEPICVTHDFNIGIGKPMSACIGQYVGGAFHVFKVLHIEGARTEDIMEEIIPIISNCRIIHVYGDASGKNNDTRSKGSDYDIIRNSLGKLSHNPIIEMKVPKANPPIRRRHNTTNACFFNEKKEVRLFLYKGCEWLSKGFRLTQLKEGANIIEDDSLPEQHATTAIGYWIDYKINKELTAQAKTIQL
jgi:hypothetical protein